MSYPSRSGSAVRWIGLLGQRLRKFLRFVSIFWQSDYFKRRGLAAYYKLLIFRNQILILFHKALYRFYLCRKGVILFLSSLRVRLSLFRAERYLVAKYGRNWRSGVLNYECIQALKTFDYVHSVVWPNGLLGIIPETSEGVSDKLQRALFEEAAVGGKASEWLDSLGKCPDAGHYVAQIPGIDLWLNDVLSRWNQAGRPDLEWPAWVREGAEAVSRRVCDKLNVPYVSLWPNIIIRTKPAVDDKDSSDLSLPPTIDLRRGSREPYLKDLAHHGRHGGGDGQGFWGLPDRPAKRQSEFVFFRAI